MNPETSNAGTLEFVKHSIDSPPGNVSDVQFVEIWTHRDRQELCALICNLRNSNPVWSQSFDQENDSVGRLVSKRLSNSPSRGSNIQIAESALAELKLDPLKVKVNLDDSTGKAALVQVPKFQFVLQTPLDEGPFCSMSVHAADGFNYVGSYVYSDALFEPSEASRDLTWLIRWRWNRLPIFILPIAFLQAHNKYITTRLAQLHDMLANIENDFLRPSTNLDFEQATRRVHQFSTALSNLARRQHFQNTVIGAIEHYLTSGTDLEVQRMLLEPIKEGMRVRHYDFETLPKREATARATIFNLTVQRDQALALEIGQANLEIAQSAREIGQATMRDSAAMRTIAVMTMLFLPGTAVASFYSMTMFNWNANTGQSVASSYVWVFFVTAIPLTVLVLGAWWFWHERHKRRSTNDDDDILMLPLRK